MFKVGDKVRIKDNPDTSWSGWMSPRMDEYKGQVGIVVEGVKQNDKDHSVGVRFENGDAWYFLLTQIEEPKKISSDAAKEISELIEKILSAHAIIRYEGNSQSGYSMMRKDEQHKIATENKKKLKEEFGISINPSFN